MRGNYKKKYNENKWQPGQVSQPETSSAAIQTGGHRVSACPKGAETPRTQWRPSP